MDAKVCIQMEGKKTTISNPAVSEILCFLVALRRWLYNYRSCGCFNSVMKFSFIFFDFRVKIRILRTISLTGLLIVQTDTSPHKNR